jgi:hypothetical protein
MPLDYSPRFRFQYARLPLSTRLKVQKALRLLNADFRHPGLKSHPVRGHERIYEAYVDHKYRMTYERAGDLLIMRKLDNHDECLKNP